MIVMVVGFNIMKVICLKLMYRQNVGWRLLILSSLLPTKQISPSLCIMKEVSVDGQFDQVLSFPQYQNSKHYVQHYSYEIIKTPQICSQAQSNPIPSTSVILAVQNNKVLFKPMKSYFYFILHLMYRQLGNFHNCPHVSYLFLVLTLHLKFNWQSSVLS